MSDSAEPARLPLTSSDLAAERLARLRELLPGAFAEGKLVPARLAELVGTAAVSSAPERYGLSYAGRAEALRETLAPSHGTLRPDAAASVAWDATENLIIEGDNLHVLKLLQSAYAGAVKLIYIDPPYNTGNDFVYPDDFRAGMAHYKEITQQNLSTNPETSGRYHSDWLKLMHPRLALARNLLRDDGVIFVSIDDHEVHNLRLLMDEVFGEENFVGTFVWRRRVSSGLADRLISTDHEYVVGYQHTNFVSLGNAKTFDKYSNPDNDLRGDWIADNLTVGMGKDLRPNQFYPLTDPATGKTYAPNPNRVWAYIPESMNKLIAEGRIIFPEETSRRPMLKRFKNELRSDVNPVSTWMTEVGLNTEATREIQDIFGDSAFSYPKPTSLLFHLLKTSTGPDDLVLDFFAGSGTTAQAVLELNRQDGGDRKFILVQLPEKTGRTDFPTIADITRERVRRVIARRPADLATGGTRAEGFRAYRLDESNFKVWDGEAAPRDGEGLARQLELMAHNVHDGRSDEDLLAEILLKCGHPGITLGSPVELRTVAGQPVHLLAAGALVICLDRTLTRESLRGVIALAPKRVLCLDVGFHGNDELKTNTVLEMKSHGIQFQTV